jgi:hypothetical protein
LPLPSLLVLSDSMITLLQSLCLSCSVSNVPHTRALFFIACPWPRTVVLHIIRKQADLGNWSDRSGRFCQFLKREILWCRSLLVEKILEVFNSNIFPQHLPNRHLQCHAGYLPLVQIARSIELLWETGTPRIASEVCQVIRLLGLAKTQSCFFFFLIF